MDRPIMDRRTFLGTRGFSVLAAPLAVEAQQAAKIPRMGWLGNLGWVEDQNMVTEWRCSGGRAERFPALADELVALKEAVPLVSRVAEPLGNP